MSEWITDREAVETDADQWGMVWVTNQQGEVYRVCYEHATIRGHIAWQPIVTPVPYVKPKRYKVYELSMDRFCVGDQTSQDRFAKYIPTREAAERIAAIYEEVMP